jgi:hypothetical protein
MKKIECDTQDVKLDAVKITDDILKEVTEICEELGIEPSLERPKTVCVSHRAWGRASPW